MDIETNKNGLLSPLDISILGMNDLVPSSPESLWNFDVSTSTTIDAMPPPVNDPGFTDQQSSEKQENNELNLEPTYVNNPPETATALSSNILYQPNSTTFIDDSTTDPNYAETTVINVPVIDTTQIECIPFALPLTLRRSERLAIRRKTVDDIKDFSQSSNKTKNNDKSSTRKRKTIKNIDDYQKYFVKKNTNNKSQSKMNKKSLHRKNILNLINKGNVKEIQFLPEIGLKTAYLIVTHRTINGSFKTFEELSKLPIWKGKMWDRFITVNNLD